MPNPKSFLCLHIGYNATAAIMVDGKVVAAAQEERFTRIKNDVGFPRQAINYCLRESGLSGAELDAVGFTTTRNNPIIIKSRLTPRFSLKDYDAYYGDAFYRRQMKGESTLDFLKWLRDDPKFQSKDEFFDFSFLTDAVLADGERAEELFRVEQVRAATTYLGIAADKVKFLDHHACHAHYAYFASPYRSDDFAVITLDGWGDGRNQTVWRTIGGRLQLLAESAQNGLGHLYKMATLILGMRPDEHEYKLMGMAPYANPDYVARCRTTIDDLFDVEGMRVVSKNRPADLYGTLRQRWSDQRFDNISGAVQSVTESIACKLIANIHQETGLRNFAIAGGVAMNVKMNMEIGKLDCVDTLFVPGSGSDESLPIGGCYVLAAEHGIAAQPIDDLYLGYDVSESMDDVDWEQVATQFTVRQGVTPDDVAELLAKGDIVGRVSGRCEFGARALGNRSILANPSRDDVVRRINEAVKKRDFWMPFAASLLAEDGDTLISNPKRFEARFMALAFDTQPNNYRSIQAGIHPYDRTCRAQLVTRERAPGYHAILSAFKARTGIPALLNTSYNLHGEPIVNTAADALRSFAASGLDHLLLVDTLVSRVRG
ncbi:MAG: carbamoyltransferase C-terminal domain-containing protein [Magnetospirillum sp.]